MLWQAGQQSAECRVHDECAVVHSTGPASNTAEMMPARVIEDLRSRRHLISSAFRWKERIEPRELLCTPSIFLSPRGYDLFVAVLLARTAQAAVDVLRCNCLMFWARVEVLPLHAPPSPHPFAWPQQTSPSSLSLSMRRSFTLALL